MLILIQVPQEFVHSFKKREKEKELFILASEKKYKNVTNCHIWKILRQM
jgi:hypothetical protein